MRWAVTRRMTATFHWHNDRAVHHLLDVLERVNAETPVAKLRWSIAHLNDASPETLQRFLLIPGGEYFYVGQNHIGAFHGLGQAMWLLAIVAVAAGLITGRHQTSLSAALIPSAGVFLVFTIHKLAGFIPCRQLVREFIPLK